MRTPRPTTRHSPLASGHYAFTLVELLVVIGIIAALASLVLVGGRAAVVAAREAAIQTECTQLADGFQAYINDVSGGAYPPNQAVSGASTEVNQQLSDTFRRHFNKAFPKHREPLQLLEILATGRENGQYLLTGGEQVGLTPFEAVTFWLGGFSDDPKYPISGPGGPSFLTDSAGTDQSAEDWGSRTKIFDFAEERLGPRNDDNTFGGGGRYIVYPDPVDSSRKRRINLWVYNPKNLTVPYAYFDASSKPKFETAFGGVVPVKVWKTNATTQKVRDLRLANEGKCQILAAGLDDAWGPFGNLFVADWTQPDNDYAGVVYPEGPFTGEAADTITNFSSARTLEDSQP